LPKNVAVAFEAATEYVSDGAVKNGSGEFRAAMRGDDIWCYGRDADGTEDYLAISPQRRAECLGSRNQSRGVEDIEADRIPWAAVDLWRFHVTPLNPAYWLPLGPVLQKGARIEMITPPAEGSTRWLVMTTTPMDGGVLRQTVELDAAYQWMVRRKLAEYPNGTRATMVTELGRIGEFIVPLRAQSTYADGSRGMRVMRKLTPTEETALRERVEQALRQPFELPALFQWPVSYAIAWPLLGATLLAVHSLLSRDPEQRRTGHI
jgi:hypothetical protein